MNTIVFDIDETLCKSECSCSSDEMDKQFEHNPTLEMFLCYWDEKHLFYPHWKILFDYLMSKNCCIVIYSAANDYRNKPLMAKYLKSIYGDEKYNELIREGQFKVYSFDNMTKEVIFPKEFIYRKTLRPLLKENQTIDNIILIDDLDYRADKNEPEFINVKVNFGDNIVSGLLGLFMTYFEEHQETASLRKFVGEMMPYDVERKRKLLVNDENEFIAKGLREIRKTDPDALFLVKLNEECPISQIPSQSFVTKELKEINDAVVVSNQMKLFKRYAELYYEPYYLSLAISDQL